MAMLKDVFEDFYQFDWGNGEEIGADEFKAPLMHYYGDVGLVARQKAILEDIVRAMFLTSMLCCMLLENTNDAKKVGVNVGADNPAFAKLLRSGAAAGEASLYVENVFDLDVLE